MNGYIHEIHPICYIYNNVVVSMLLFYGGMLWFDLKMSLFFFTMQEDILCDCGFYPLSAVG